MLPQDFGSRRGNRIDIFDFDIKHPAVGKEGAMRLKTLLALFMLGIPMRLPAQEPPVQEPVPESVVRRPEPMALLSP